MADTQKNVFFPDSPEIVCINAPDLDVIRQAAQSSPLGRARYCLHPSHDDPVQQMIVAFIKDSRVPVHRHRQKSESFHVIEGELEVQLYNDSGSKVETIKMGTMESGLTFVYRINTDTWHTVKPLSPMVIIHEILTGPFDGEMEIFSK